MAYYPVALRLDDRDCLVVGGGSVALRKVESLLECGARVTVVAPQVDEALKKSAGPRLKILETSFQVPMMMEEMFLVVVATDDPALNRSVAAFALERNILVNVVDDPEKCNFIVPSTLKRGDLLVSVTTSGRSPALSRRIRRDLEHIFPESLDEILDLVSAARDSMKASLSSDREREAFWREFFSSPIINDWEHLRLRLEQILKE